MFRCRQYVTGDSSRGVGRGAISVQKLKRKRIKEFGQQLKARSRITNGRDILPTIDHRSAWTRRYRDLNAAFLSDLGQDEDSLSSGQLALCKHTAAMCVELEFLTVKFAENGGADVYDLNVFQRASTRCVVVLKAWAHIEVVLPRTLHRPRLTLISMRKPKTLT